MAVHLYILYWGMLSFITPPVALGAFAASSVSGSPPMKTGFTACRLGLVIYLLPVFFVLNPALIGRGDTTAEFFLAFSTALIGIWILASSSEGFLVGIGTLPVIARIIIGISAAALAFPDMTTDIIGFLVIIVSILVLIIRKRKIESNQELS